MLEKHIEARVVVYAKGRGFYVRKFTSPSHRAVPDRILIKRGRVFFIEFKAPGKRETPAQDREHRRLRTVDAPVYVIDDIKAGERLIDEIDAALPK